MTTTVFVYGTLTDADRASSVLPEATYRGRATLVGCHVERGRYPTLVPGGTATGRLLATAHLDRLDRYEGVAEGLYVRVAVPTAEDDTVWTYVGDPDRLGVDADWPGDGPLAERIRRYVDDRGVLVRQL